MSNMRVIRSDDNGIYVKTGGYVFRPIPENKDSKLKAGDKVAATHIGGSTAARVGNEVWFSDVNRHKYAGLADYLDEKGRLWWGDGGVTVRLDNGQHVKLIDWLRKL